jgi:hypothetical protein
MPVVAPALIAFTPERWGEVERFQRFCGVTYAFDVRDQRALAGTSNHFLKAQRLRRLAEKLKPNLEIDHAQLEETGYTAAENSAELATVFESSILELYSSVDCVVKVLRAIYGKKVRGFKGSTRGFFQNIDKLGEEFPRQLMEIIASADWYKSLLHLRDELTHLDTGNVGFHAQSGRVWYRHSGIKEGGNSLLIEDISGWFDDISTQINGFLGGIFHFLNLTLEDKAIFQMCGMVEGRVLHRYVSPRENLSFDSGSCGAWAWFELPENPSCPFKENCGAYSRKAPPQGWETAQPLKG